MNLFSFLNRQRRWSSNTFGDTPRTEAVLRHIEKEIAEVRAAPNDLEEWCDIVILALDGAWRAGHNASEICRALEAKQAKNRTRAYPKTDDNQPSEHVRDLDKQAVVTNGIQERFQKRKELGNALKAHYRQAYYDGDPIPVDQFNELVDAIMEGR